MNMLVNNKSYEAKWLYSMCYALKMTTLKVWVAYTSFEREKSKVLCLTIPVWVFLVLVDRKFNFVCYYAYVSFYVYL